LIELQIADFCREIEKYLCRKNDGHLIRVTGPSFGLVAGWAAQGVPLKVAFKGIDRYFERYYRNGPRRRPVKIDFCEADVLDVFDEWRRAVGVVALARESHIANQESQIPEPASQNANPESRIPSPEPRRPSLTAHLERALLRLSEGRAAGIITGALDPLIDRVSRELDAVRAKPGGLRGEYRSAAIARLTELDAELVRSARALVDQAALAAMQHEADDDLAPFRAGMSAEAYTRARDAAVNRLVRERFGLPTIAYT
jgi:hypothetical protein